jgi:outer membrane lipoprotein-sorting protein
MAFIADVFSVTLIDIATNDAIATTTLTDASIDVKVTENEIRGGSGNQLLGSLHVARDITISLTDIEFKYSWLSKQLGQDVKTGAGVAYAAPKYYTVVDNSGTLKITLDKTPSDANTLAIYDADGVKISSSAYTVSTSTVTFTTGVVAGDSIEVRTYTYATSAETQTIEFDSAVFAKGMKAILETVEIDGNENITHTLQYQFDSTVPDGNFTIATKSDKTAASQAFGLKVIKPETTTVVGRLLRIPYVA